MDQKCQDEYVRRIHTVQDYMEQHLGQPMSIEELSLVAGFSKYHFSRIFQGIVQEPLAHYVNRIKMENGLFLLAHREDKNMTDIAYELGYTDSAVFSRAFKNYFGISPREYRKEYQKNCDGTILLSDYKNGTKGERKGEQFPVKGQITIENMEEKNVVYIRHTGTYEELANVCQELAQNLFSHAAKQNLLVGEQNWVLSIYHDNPEFTAENQFRTSLCMTVPDQIPIQEDGVLGCMKLEGGLYAVGHFRIKQEQYRDAWNYMYQEWITGSGYVPRNSYPFEVYCNDPQDNEEHLHEVEIYVPIEPFKF
ncbi:AraC family transcriptional regulator [Anaerosporobacter faecicola]|uniref:AraC family transcriptional regulator n=1 Tax=Anaerosporobacter faecicola TaxID=2718714 RepID=UPI00143C6ACE|nr:GyrI-like domain-containing protein [Anaerosporobacter faecicola]